MEADIMAMMRKRTMSKVSTWNEKSRVVPITAPSGGMHMPTGGIHFPGTHKPHKRADALTEENMLNAGRAIGTSEEGKQKVRIAATDLEREKS